MYSTESSSVQHDDVESVLHEQRSRLHGKTMAATATLRNLFRRPGPTNREDLRSDSVYQSIESYSEILSSRFSGATRTSMMRRRIGEVHIMTCKERVQAFLDSKYGVLLETFNVVLSISLIVVAVIHSYRKHIPEVEHNITLYFELAANILFAVDFV